MNFNFFYLKFIVASYFFLTLAGCATIYNPATQKNEAIFINSMQEVQIGRSMSENVINKKTPLLQDAQKQRYVNIVGQRITQVCDRRDIVYHFFVLDSPDFNAFALPGGYVYIFNGLLDRLTEPQLAAVFAHEIGHISAKHSVKRMQAALGYDCLMGVALIGLGSKDPQLVRAVSNVSGPVYDLLSRGYSRADELQADKLGVKYLSATSYDPMAMVEALEILKSQAGPSGRVFEILSTHPRMEERIKKAKEEVVALKNK